MSLPWTVSSVRMWRSKIIILSIFLQLQVFVFVLFCCIKCSFFSLFLNPFMNQCYLCHQIFEFNLSVNRCTAFGLLVKQLVLVMVVYFFLKIFFICALNILCIL